MSPNGPLGCSAVGPSSSSRRVIWLRSSSYSTGIWVFSIGITALFFICGPPVYGGDSWMTRDATRLGFSTDAVAFSGILYLLLTWKTTFILSPSVSMLSIAPTLTPMMRTLSPGYSASTSGKYAVTVVVVSFLYRFIPK